MVSDQWEKLDAIRGSSMAECIAEIGMIPREYKAVLAKWKKKPVWKVIQKLEIEDIEALRKWAISLTQKGSKKCSNASKLD